MGTRPYILAFLGVRVRLIRSQELIRVLTFLTFTSLDHKISNATETKKSKRSFDS